MCGLLGQNWSSCLNKAFVDQLNTAYALCVEARNALRADIEEIRSVITDADRIAGKWGKDDKVV